MTECNFENLGETIHGEQCAMYNGGKVVKALSPPGEKDQKYTYSFYPYMQQSQNPGAPQILDSHSSLPKN